MVNLAIPAPANGVAGVDVTAAFWNAQVRDTIKYLINPPIFKGTTSVAVSIPNNAFTTVALNTNVVDSYGGHSVSTNTSRYVAQAAGWYWAAGAASWANNVTGERGAMLSVNGALVNETFQQTLSPGALTAGIGVAPGPLFLNVNDYLELSVYQNSGGALNVTAAFLSALWVHV